MKYHPMREICCNQFPCTIATHWLHSVRGMQNTWRMATAVAHKTMAVRTNVPIPKFPSTRPFSDVFRSAKQNFKRISLCRLHVVQRWAHKSISTFNYYNLVGFHTFLNRRNETYLHWLPQTHITLVLEALRRASKKVHPHQFFSVRP